MTIMNKWTAFQDYCAKQGIPHEITALGYEFTNSEFNLWRFERKETLHPAFDFGKYEYRYLVTVEQGIETIKGGVMAAIRDYDSLGRSIEQLRLKQLLKNSDKHLNYRVCKTYYLWLGNQYGNGTDSLDDDNVWSFRFVCAQTYDTHFPTIWNKHLVKETE